jgi:hypothetical protein
VTARVGRVAPTTVGENWAQNLATAAIECPKRECAMERKLASDGRFAADHADCDDRRRESRPVRVFGLPAPGNL